MLKACLMTLRIVFKTDSSEGIHENIAPAIWVMVRLKRTLILSRWILEDESLVNQTNLEKVKSRFSKVLGQTTHQPQKVEFVSSDDWELSAEHNGLNLLAESKQYEVLLQRVKALDFAKQTDPRRVSGFTVSEAEREINRRAFHRDARSFAPYSGLC